MEFGRQMRVLRVARALSLMDVAEITGIHVSTLSQYEARGMDVSQKHMDAILKGYGFPPEGLREIAFGILEGSVDAAGLVDKLLAVKLVEKA
jgi:transcriptional regulator with XRE-family HTH domain